MAQPQTPSTSFTGYQKFVVALLAFLQFTIILDFMIISPLGAVLMPALHITPSQFGVVVSAYAFSAGLSGILAAGFADRFDRKRLLLFFYTGFVVGTLLCGIAPNFHFLMMARIVTGIFGGVIGSIVLAITTDLFEYQMRGRVMGFIQSAFAGSQVLGIPIGLYFSNLWGWHAPFIMIVVISAIVGVFIVLYLKPIRGHITQKTDHHPFHHLWVTLTNPFYFIAFSSMALLTIGGYMLMPFGSAFHVHNLGVPLDRLPLIFLVTGIFAMGIGPLVGKLSDKFGKFPVFLFGVSLTIVMVTIYTHMTESPLWVVMLVNVLMFVGIFSRMIPAQTMMSAIPKPENRGAFMAVSSSVQQISGGLASVVAGMIVVESETGRIEHFDTLGYALVGSTLITIFLVRIIHVRTTQMLKATGQATVESSAT